MTFTKGDVLEMEYDGHTVQALVVMASSNGLSLFLSFEAMLGGYAGMMPVLDDGHGYHDFMGRPVALRSLDH